MIRNYLKVAIRNILKHKVFSVINILGLALAMSVCMLIILMFAEEKSYDQFHEKKERIYRILSDRDNSKLPSATSPFPLADVLNAEYPVVEEATRLTRGVGGDISNRQQAVEVRGYFADPAFFNVFSFTLDQGDPGGALASPYSIVITRALAQKLFGQNDAVGKTISFSDRGLLNLGDQPGKPGVSWDDLTVTGVLADEYKSHLKFDVLVSSSTIISLVNEGKMADHSNQWGNNQSYTYALLQPGKTRKDLTDALADLIGQRRNELRDIEGFTLIAQELVDITPGILVTNEPTQRLPIAVYYFLSFLAAIIMISACMNYTNLTTARALTRAREIGVRIVNGAHRKDLVYQFLGESIITALLALGMATLLLVLLKASIVQLWVNQYLHFELRENLQIYAIFIGFAILVGLAAGVYPAAHLSRRLPAKILKNSDESGTGKLRMRKVLAVSQFVVSLFFITTSILIYNQFHHFLRFEYGFNPENIVNVPLKGNDFQKISTAFAGIPGVSAISACDYVPSTGTNNGISLKPVEKDVPYQNLVILIANENFAENLQLHLLTGRHLTATDSANRFIVVNEAAVKALGYNYPDDIVGQELDGQYGGGHFQVIGVVNNFYVKVPMGEDKVSPMILRYAPAEFRYANVRIASPDITSTISAMEKRWKEVDHRHAFEYEFYDQQLAAMNRGLFDIVSVLGFIAFMAVTIACLGMLGMSTYTCERRKKEMGIRKVFGARDAAIALLLSRDFLTVLGVSICIGGPLSYTLNNLWLQHLPNRVEFGAGTLVASALILLSLGLITIGSQAIMASRRNPIEPLRAE
jgi:putative ABC transport system permease protein